ncbi:hypothetical protein L484_016402 [Morus notabilis]|uniref:Uncharacterized protein n=1 Tax=Morus notabilis TaxID=981085 RepID=W9RYU0_9ROSA|nr:hypothetical protein L484_016402 [Morus notabilis]
MTNPKEEAITTDDHDNNSDFSFSYLHGWLNMTPQFMMYVYKIKPCKRTVCNFPCTPCPFLHDGEVGWRDLLWNKYSCIPCVDFNSAGNRLRLRARDPRAEVPSHALQDQVLLVHDLMQA